MANTFVALDWDQKELRFLEGSGRDSRVKVRRAGAAEFPPDLWEQGPEAVGQFVADTLRRARVRTTLALACVPRSRGILKDIVFPTVADDEVAGVVHFQAVKDLSFPAEEAVLDFAVTGTDEQGRTAALVAAVRNDVIEEHQRIAEAAGLKLAHLGLRAHADLTALTACVPEIRTSGKAILLVEVGAELAEISVVCGGRLLFSRATTLGGPALRTSTDTGTLEFLPEDELREAQRSYRSLCNEVSRCMQAYQGQPEHQRVEQAYVVCASNQHATLADRLREATGLATQRVAVFETLSAQAEHPDSQGSLSAVLGLILEQSHPQGVPFDFLNPKKPKVVRDRRPVLATLGLGAAGLAIAVGIMFFLKVKSEREARQAALKKSQAKQMGKLKQFRELQRKLKLVERWSAHRTNWLNEIQRLSELFPATDHAYVEAAGLRQLKLPVLKRRRRSRSASKQTSPTKVPVASVSLKGQARSRSLVGEMLRTAMAKGWYRAQPGGMQPRADETPYRIRFDFNLSVLQKTAPSGAAASQPTATQPAKARDTDQKLHQDERGGVRTRGGKRKNS